MKSNLISSGLYRQTIRYRSFCAALAPAVSHHREMDFNAILLLLAASLAITSSQRLPPRAIASIMQEILSPKTTEQFADAIRGAAISRTPLAELLANRKRNIVSETGLARNFARKEILQAGMPRKDAIQQVVQPKVILQKPNEIVLPKKVTVRNSIPNNIAVKKSNDVVNLAMQNANEMPTQTKILIKKPELATPKKVLVQNPEGNKRILVDKANAIPMLRNLLLQIDNTIASKGLHPKTVVVKDVPRAESEIKPVPTVLVQKSGTSPMTATSTVSNALPQSRGQFLRKIPIPPPTI